MRNLILSGILLVGLAVISSAVDKVAIVDSETASKVGIAGQKVEVSTGSFHMLIVTDTLKFGDATTMTTAASGGVDVADNNTWTGANTYTGVSSFSAVVHSSSQTHFKSDAAHDAFIIKNNADNNTWRVGVDASGWMNFNILGVDRITFPDGTGAGLKVTAGTTFDDALALHESNGDEGWDFRVNSSGDLLIGDQPNSVALTFQDVTQNIGVGTTNPATSFDVKGGTLAIRDVNSLILVSPDGTCATCAIDNSDVFTCVSVACP